MESLRQRSIALANAHRPWLANVLRIMDQFGDVVLLEPEDEAAGGVELPR